MRLFDVLDWLLELVTHPFQFPIIFPDSSQESLPSGTEFTEVRAKGLVFDLTDAERDRRSGDEWLLSICSYLEFRSGSSWRKFHRSGERWNEVRWHYLGALRLLKSIRYAPEARPALVLKKPARRHLPTLAQVERMKAVRA